MLFATSHTNDYSALSRKTYLISRFEPADPSPGLLDDPGEVPPQGEGELHAWRSCTKPSPHGVEQLSTIALWGWDGKLLLIQWNR